MRETRGSQPEDSSLPRDPDNRRPRLTGVKGSDLIRLLLRTIKGLKTIYRRLSNFSLPTNGRGPPPLAGKEEKFCQLEFWFLIHHLIIRPQKIRLHCSQPEQIGKILQKGHFANACFTPLYFVALKNEVRMRSKILVSI